MSTRLDIEATRLDQQLLESLHPVSTKILRWAGEKKIRFVPVAGTIITDGEMIREALVNKAIFSKQGKGASSGLWNPIIGDTGLLNMDGAPHLELRRSLASTFSPKNIESFILPELEPALNLAVEELKAGKRVDLVALVSGFAYKALWRLAGYPEELIAKRCTPDTIKELRSVTHGVNLARKKLTSGQIRKAKTKLSFIDEVTSETFYNYASSLPEGSILKEMFSAGYTLKDTTSLMKALMIAGTETIISFAPRMVALLVDSGSMPTLTEERIPAAVEECLRVTVPTAVSVRVVKQDTVLKGYDLKRQSRLILNTLGACQKYGPFDSEFPPVPREIKGLWFGAGTHMCIGLPVAMLEAESVLKALVGLNSYGALSIVDRKAATKGHTGSYERLVVELRRDNG